MPKEGSGREGTSPARTTRSDTPRRRLPRMPGLHPGPRPGSHPHGIQRHLASARLFPPKDPARARTSSLSFGPGCSFLTVMVLSISVTKAILHASHVRWLFRHQKLTLGITVEARRRRFAFAPAALFSPEQSACNGERKSQPSFGCGRPNLANARDWGVIAPIDLGQRSH